MNPNLSERAAPESEHAAPESERVTPESERAIPESKCAIPEFVAEVSSNHHRDLPRCLQFVDLAAQIGCSAVKFQLFRIEELFAPEILEWSPLHRARKLWEIPLPFIPEIKRRCEEKGILFSCTPFYLKAVDELFPYVDFYKIASYELLWNDLLTACASTGKPVVLSTGMATLDEIGQAVTVLHQAGCRDLTLLHCVSGYPAPVSECNLAAIETLRRLMAQMAPMTQMAAGISPGMGRKAGILSGLGLKAGILWGLGREPAAKPEPEQRSPSPATGSPCQPPPQRGEGDFRMKIRVGWSDHSIQPGVLYRAVHRWQADMVEFHLDIDGTGEEFCLGHCWLPEQIKAVIDQIKDGFRADGTGQKRPVRIELPDRNWRRDPSDGLRPLKDLRLEWVKSRQMV